MTFLLVSILFQGINNPVVCLSYGEAMIWTVTRDKYPRYDETNLWNDVPTFDYGAFRRLDEQQRVGTSARTLFAFRFQTAGMFAFRMTNDTANQRRMVRVFSHS